MATLMFDQSLGRLVRVISDRLGADALEAGVILRDATGRLSFVANLDSPSTEQRAAVSSALAQELGAYARKDRVIAFRDEPGAAKLLSDTSRLPVQVGVSFCQLIDRRIVGAGWLDSPAQEGAAGPPRIVFSSLKGGVGRSTALAVTAADLARRNQNVLVIDLDLEAPGIGNLLLGKDRIPRYGVIDYLVENGIGGVTLEQLTDFVSVSELTTGGTGRVEVVPALGAESVQFPENVLAKLARAMVDDITEEGSTITVASQIASMIDLLIKRSSYDVVLIDSRAGFGELAAPAILALGGIVLLFGTAQEQTIEGYRALLAALRLLAQRDRSEGRKAEWRLMLKTVYAKSSLSSTTAKQFREDLSELFSEFIYDVEEPKSFGASEGIRFATDDPEAPHWPLVIPFSQSFVDFDPVRSADQLTQVFYEQAFRPFLDGLDSLITPVDKVLGSQE